MNPIEIIEKFYEKGSPLYRLLVSHSEKVAEKSLAIAAGLPPHLSPDRDLLHRGAMLHDIGIVRTKAPAIHCHGDLPYVCHGYLGRQMLDDLGLDPALGLVAERHTGAGISLANIRNQNLPLPQRDMIPLSLEEKIICCADKYFSKSPDKQGILMTRATIVQELQRMDSLHAQRFSQWAEVFNLP